MRIGLFLVTNVVTDEKYWRRAETQDVSQQVDVHYYYSYSQRNHAVKKSVVRVHIIIHAEPIILCRTISITTQDN